MVRETVRRLARAVGAVAAVAALVVCAPRPAAPDDAPTPAPAPRASPSAAPTAPPRAPPTLLRVGVEPPDAVFRQGETVRLALVLTNAEPAPITVEGLPPTVTLGKTRGPPVRTLPGAADAAATLAPGAAYRHEVVWDQRADDGGPAPLGRYGASLSPLVVRHAGGSSHLTLGIGTGAMPAFVVHPAAGVRTGELRPGLAAASDGVTLTVDRLVLGRREAQLEAHIAPPLPNRSVRGAPFGDWRVEAIHRLDGGPPEPLPSPGFGVDDPGRTALTWTLDPLPATAQTLDLAVNLSGEARGSWSFRVPLATAVPSVSPQALAAGAPAPRPGAPPMPGWRPSANHAATDQGFQVVRLGTVAQTLSALARPGYLAAYVAFVAPPGDRAIPAPAAGQLRGVDSLGQRYAVEYTEVVRQPGATVGAAVLRGPPAGRKTLSLEVDALDVAGGPAGRAQVRGRWTIGLVDQLVDVLPPALVTMPSGKQVIEANGARIHYATGVGGPDGQAAAFTIERPGASADPSYVMMALDTGALRPLNRAAGDCYFARLYEPTPVGGGPPPTSTPRPGPPATSTPVGMGCAQLATASPAPPNAGAAASPPTGTPWPLLGAAPTPCPAYTTPSGGMAAWPTVDPNNPATLLAFDPCAIRVPKNPNALRPSGGPYLSRQEIERRVAGGVRPSKMRSYLVTYAAANRLIGGDSEGPDVYPDREVWLVVVAQDPYQCARPSLAPGVPEWPRRWCFGVYDATTGRAYYVGGNGSADHDWPAHLPRD